MAYDKLNTTAEIVDGMLVELRKQLAAAEETNTSTIQKNIAFLTTLFQLSLAEGQTYQLEFSYSQKNQKKSIRFDFAKCDDENTIGGVNVKFLTRLFKSIKVKNDPYLLSGSSSGSDIGSPKAADSEAVVVSPVTPAEQQLPEKEEQRSESPLIPSLASTQKHVEDSEEEDATKPVASEEVILSPLTTSSRVFDSPLEATQKPATADDRTEAGESEVKQEERTVETATKTTEAIKPEPTMAQKIIKAIDEQYLNVRRQENYGFFARHFDFTRGIARANIFKRLLNDNQNIETAVNIIAYALLATKNGVKLKEAVSASLGKIDGLDPFEYFSQKIAVDEEKKFAKLDSVVKALVYSTNRKGENLEKAEDSLRGYLLLDAADKNHVVIDIRPASLSM